MPRADFACLSKKCKRKKGAEVYELPTNATRCPVCGSKKITRLYNKVNVSSGLARRTDKIFEPAYAEARSKVDLDAVSRANKANGRPFMVPLNKVQGAVAEVTGGAIQDYAPPGKPGKSAHDKGEVLFRPPSAETAVIHQQRPMPSVVIEDKEKWGIGKNKKGQLVPVKYG